MGTIFRTDIGRTGALRSLLLAAACAVTLVTGGQAAFAANLLENTATATGTPAAGTLTDPTASETVDVVNKAPALSLTKTITSVTTANGASATATDGGDIISYQYVITNTGNQTLTGVIPTDAGPTFDGNAATNSLSAFSPAAVTLAPGASQTFTATYTLAQADVNNAAGVTNGVSNTASADGTDPQSVVIHPVCGASCTATTTILNAPAMTVAKTITSVTTTNGASATLTDGLDVITYQYVLTNTGNVTLTGVTPTDAGPTFDSNAATNALSAFSPAPVTLAPGAAQTFTATYILAQDDVDNAAGVTNGVSNTGSGTSTDPASNVVTPLTPSTATTTIGASPVMTIAKVGVITTDGGTSGEADKDDVITYTYTVTNTGNVTINNVTVGDSHNGTGTAPVPGNEADLVVTHGSTDAAVNASYDVLKPGDSITFTSTYTVVQTDVDTLQ